MHTNILYYDVNVASSITCDIMTSCLVPEKVLFIQMSIFDVAYIVLNKLYR